MTKTTREIYREKAEALARDAHPHTQLGVGCMDLLALLDDAAQYELVDTQLREMSDKVALERVASLMVRAGIDVVDLTAGWMRHIHGGPKAISKRLLRPAQMGAEVFADVLQGALAELGAREQVHALLGLAPAPGAIQSGSGRLLAWDP